MGSKRRALSTMARTDLSLLLSEFTPVGPKRVVRGNLRRLSFLIDVCHMGLPLFVGQDLSGQEIHLVSAREGRGEHVNEFL